jgi:ribose transport system ATP-binding protein
VRDRTHDGIALLRVSALSKHFGGALALDDVSLEVGHGEVHGLLGQNGSGKSTLIKILAGFHEPDPGGQLWLDGQELRHGTGHTEGISFVHQHLGLIPSMTVLENLLIGDLAHQDRWRIDWAAETRRAAGLFGRYDLDINPAQQVARLSPVERALLAILRAFDHLQTARAQGGHAGLLILDEPTPFLPGRDVSRLFELVRGIVRDGASVIFVSHDIDEVLEITDRATVLRDGRVAGSFETRATRKEEIVRMIVGRGIGSGQRLESRILPGPALLRITGLTGGAVRDVSLHATPGEVLGLTGLIGSGYDEVLSLIYGAEQALDGTLTLDGRAVDLRRQTPAAAIGAGCVLVPGDRLNAGGVGALSVLDNISLPVLGRVCSEWRIRRKPLVANATSLAEDFDVRPRDPALPFQSLSGGNQQKVLLAKWFQTAPRLILLDEPAQGVDVGAREQVFAAIRDAAGSGAAILCASSDYEQLTAICDRVLIFDRGRIAAELSGADITKTAIAASCYAHAGDHQAETLP